MFAPEIHAARRRALLESGLSGIAVFPGNVEAPMNYLDNCYPFRQDSTFLYYFGHDLPGLWGTVDFDAGECALWGEDATMDDIIWSGPVPSVAERAARVGAERHGSLAGLADFVREAQRQGRAVHFLPQYRAENRERLEALTGIPAARQAEGVSRELSVAVVDQRSVKAPEEVVELEKAQVVSYDMYAAAMRMARLGVPEREIAGAMIGVVARSGAIPSFPLILSVHGETLHIRSHANILEAGNLLLIDSGAESPEHYASDITRVIPVGGRFDARQKSLYSILHDAQVAACAACRPGVTYRELHLATARRIAEGLTALGIMKGNPAEAVEAGAHALFMPHGLGHMMGLDVHDMENIGENLVGYGDELTRSSQFGLSALRLARTLRPGFVMTVEPGIYFIPALVAKWRAEGRNEAFIDYAEVEKYLDYGGMRLEDDVLVTDDGARVLGPGIPKSIADIEAFMAD
ncbi:Xaa-Pro aminopeptidase [Desulfobaculum xiamenense]|uniref:Xaa-Pro aminopeptidase n=1 Tax=Desulfobaculum xiamenense TaxID=995050 RepID=A0A846QNK6_9BACT|nr:aminopeptidase P family protein [Desulfobaculum xiamenense]NJB66804.1 Xaa-Pro aminopeptidase [Desulfobaculum xiamenense]